MNFSQIKILKKCFGFDPSKTTVKTEIIAGITTFLTMAYVLAVHPNILSDAGMDKGALFTTTALSAVLATMLMAFWAKLPFGVAPGMGLNAFFAYTVCLTMGYPWQFALAAVFIEGVIFIILTLTNLREMIVNAIPRTLKNAITVGIGLFIAFIGLHNAGIIVKNDATLVSLGSLTSGPALLGIIGIIISSILLVKQVRGALLLGIFITAIIGIPMGLTHFTGVFSTPPSIEPIFMQLDFSQIFTKDMIIVVFTFLFLDMFDTIGTFVGVATKVGMVDKNGRIPRIKQGFMADAIGTTAGALLGTSTVTTFVESASGVGEGGRSGLTAFVISICCLISLVFAPLFLSIPAAATSPVLILVGLMMITCFKDIDFEDYSEAIPAFICMLFMPLAYSISDGIVLGLISYVLINLLCGKVKKLSWTMVILSVIFVLKFFV